MKRYCILIFLFLFSVHLSCLKANSITEIENLVYGGIVSKSFPGAQLLIGTPERILMEKNFGKYTYDSDAPDVTSSSIYDLASVTKVIATTSAIMQLYDNGKLNINDNVWLYIPEFANNGKEDIKITNLLLHNSGLKAWVPFYKTLTTKQQVLDEIYNMTPDYKTGTKFVYSDLNAVLLGLIVEKISGMPLDEYCRINIFEPLGMRSTTYLPKNELKKLAVPTENDTYWRNRLLQGEVHDETAAMLDGVSGNAGLFSNAKDLYWFMVMMLVKGKYYNPYSRGLKEEKFASADVVNLFIKKWETAAYNNSRGLGWDTKPEPTSYRTPCGEKFSENSFGHTGYTGTSVWADTDKNLIVIFLTNRVYPSRDNNGIREIRPEIHNMAVELLNGN
ncbi:MAG: serine hydrolase [Bacteroidetes bacterium]|nr:serine hydrolase [Bacteroidota bacterium]